MPTSWWSGTVLGQDFLTLGQSFLHPFLFCPLLRTWFFSILELGEGTRIVQFSHSVMFDFLWLHELQDARLPFPSPTPGAWSNLPIKSVMPPNHLILCHPCLRLPSIFPSIRVFSNESVLGIGWPNYWSFSFSISPSNEYSGLTSFKIDWFDLCAVQGTLKSLLDHHSSKASIVEEAVSFFFLFYIYLFVCSRS